MPTPLSFPELVHQARVALDYDLQTTARGAGCSESYVSLIEADKRLPSEELAIRLARTLRIDPTEALLALLRSRLGPSARGLLDPASLLRDESLQKSVARRFLCSRFDARIARVTSRVEIAWSGDAVSSHTFEGVAPVPGRPPLTELVVREALSGMPAAKLVNANQKPRVLALPAGLHFEYEGAARGPEFVHLFAFPEGFAADAGAPFSFTTRLEVRRAFALDLASTLAARGAAGARNHVLKWCFPRYVAAAIDRLRIEVAFPERYRPADLGAIAWIGDGPIEDVPGGGIDPSVCGTHELRFADGVATLDVEEPLPCFSFAIAWRPMERAEAIAARRGAQAGT